ncbi:MAG: hypothetical protein OEV14_11705, partial [Gammaproteobacteria bacterium]|nr:hypothetical protein [Gammaproteobacteria bacterium]
AGKSFRYREYTVSAGKSFPRVPAAAERVLVAAEAAPTRAAGGGTGPGQPSGGSSRQAARACPATGHATTG